MNTRLLNLEEAAERIGHSPHTLRQWVQKGRVNHIRLNRRIMFEPKDLGDLIKTHRVMARGTGD
jgi:predicted site-specific integrase-resolvase